MFPEDFLSLGTKENNKERHRKQHMKRAKWNPNP
jgi:hypothetical protein